MDYKIAKMFISLDIKLVILGYKTESLDYLR